MKSATRGERVDRVRARVCKIAFESLYGPFSWAYDWVSRIFFRGQWRLWQSASIRFLRGSHILEVGMGTGNVQLELHRRGFEAWGVDLSPQMVRRAAAKARRLRVPIRACRARAQALPFPDECFDSVVSTFPSEYIADPHTLRELHRVLRPNGRLVVVPGGWLKPKGTRGKALDSVARLVYGYKASGEPADLEALERQAREGSGPFRWITALRERLGEAGFSLSAHVASNELGACLILVGDRS